ncbi:class I adenylate-forming enzyme family protein [Streptomyces sp. NPDC054884]|uniref:class I adenylate-forming enzyme family protein n=1 Tax=Streptomyces sp. ME08-AFT2 TaxID=3028683 RepID=UPI0029BCC1C4|nr:long-chain fatty acid--CoA ligase [Streptomyces sp. ME08-AFT2]MDX3311252.1 long-chain fatty acid--CoA ligase [Streptomyces sp. ME08-AFT2]
MKGVGALEASVVQHFLQHLVQADRPEARLPALDTLVDDLRTLGVQPGRTVMVAMPNGGAFTAVVLALLAHGAVPALLPPSAPPSRIERMARALGADALVAPRIPAELLGGGAPHSLGGIALFATLPCAAPRAHRPGEIILLTSGTSGVFSGCLHRVDSLLRNAARHAGAIGQNADDTVLINLPMHYSYAFVAQLLATLVAGGRAVVSGPPFTPAGYRRTIEEYGVSVSSLTPALVETWRRAGRPLPAPLRRLTVGGDAFGASSVADLLAHNPGLELYLTYGLTEAGPRVSTLAAHLEPPRRHTSVGLPLPGVEVRLRTENPGDRVGELIVDTDTAMLRRVGRRETSTRPDDDGDGPATSDTGTATGAPGPVRTGIGAPGPVRTDMGSPGPVPTATGASGPVRTAIATGDLFERDDDGYLFFRGRRPSYVISRGEKVSLRSVCEIAETLPGVHGAQAWTHENDAGDVVFTLDVYCADDSVDDREIRRRLAKVLLRSEQPARVLVHPAAHLGWRKSVAK